MSKVALFPGSSPAFYATKSWGGAWERGYEQGTVLNNAQLQYQRQHGTVTIKC